MLGHALRTWRRVIRGLAADRTEAVIRRSALILAPHADDETLGCGATIQRKLAAGAQVSVVIVADGRHSHHSAYLDPEALAGLRHAEAVEAMRCLGVPGDALHQLGYLDQSLSRHEDELVGVIGKLIATLQPDEVYVTGAFEPHPDHAALGRAARRAVASADQPVLLMEYPIWLWSQLWHGIAVPWRTRLATLASAFGVLSLARRAVLVRAGDALPTKRKALDAYVTQLRRPDGVPETEPWWGLPAPLLAAAAQPTEMFFPWRRRNDAR